MAIITKEQYTCAMTLIRNYKANSNFKECGTEYMDDAEKNTYGLALYQIYQYGQQIAAHRRELKRIRVKGA